MTGSGVQRVPITGLSSGRVVVDPEGSPARIETRRSVLDSLRRLMVAPPLSRRFRTTIWLGLAVIILIELVATALSLDGTDPGSLAELLGVCLLVMLASVRVTWGTLLTFVLLMTMIAVWNQGAVSLGLVVIACMVARTVRLPFGVLSAVLYLTWSVTSTVVRGTDPFLAIMGDLLVAGGALAGLLLRRQARRLESAEEDLVRQKQVLRESLDAERRQIAAELHDVVAHGLTIISMQASVLELVDDEKDRQDAQRAIGEAARQSLLDLRRMLTVLHTTDRAYGVDDAEMTGSLQGRMAEFTDRLHRAGFAVQAEVPELPGLSRSLQLTLVRVAQECTTNILKHAAPPGEVSLVLHAEGGYRLTVTSPPPQGRAHRRLPDSGFGLAGMQERVALFGGTLHYGPEDGHWVVRANFPQREA